MKSAYEAPCSFVIATFLLPFEQVVPQCAVLAWLRRQKMVAKDFWFYWNGIVNHFSKNPSVFPRCAQESQNCGFLVVIWNTGSWSENPKVLLYYYKEQLIQQLNCWDTRLILLKDGELSHISLHLLHLQCTKADIRAADVKTSNAMAIQRRAWNLEQTE